MNDLTAKLKARLSGDATTVESSRRILKCQPPDTLFHYTDAAGLMGILDSSKLWATYYRFLNDSKEVVYAAELLETIVRDRQKTASGEVESEFLARVLRTANAFDGMFDFYIACFCERDDLLNQWRVYADAGGGFALGFEARQIPAAPFEDTTSHYFYLRKVEYNREVQYACVAEVIDLALKALSEYASGLSVQQANTMIAVCCHFVRVESADYFMAFKHPAFSEEREWRLCHITSPGEDGHVRFRNGPYGVTPYVELEPHPRAGVNRGRLPISRVTFGPTHDPSNTRFSLEKLLRVKGYGFVNVGGSDLPVRGGL